MNTKTAKDPVQDIIDGSGNSFQCRVAAHFRLRGWTVLISPYYIDAGTDKARELDLICEKAFVFNQHEPKTVLVRLYIECKYAPHQVVFWFDTRDYARAKQWIHTHTPFRDNNIYSKEHHYNRASEDVAKLFASSQTTGGDNDPVFKALNQCLNGYVYNRHREPLTQPAPRQIHAVLEYPVIVFSSFAGFHRTTVAGGEPPQPITENFLLEVNYAYVAGDKSASTEYFLIDVLAFDKIDRYLKFIENELQHLAHLIS